MTDQKNAISTVLWKTASILCEKTPYSLKTLSIR